MAAAAAAAAAAVVAAAAAAAAAAVVAVVVTRWRWLGGAAHEGGHIVHYDGGLGAAVVHRGEGLEALRARRVPDPELDLVVAVLLRHRALQEGGAHRRHLGLGSGLG